MKKFLSALLVLVLLVTMIIPSSVFSVSAAGDSFSSASAISLNSYYSDNISDKEDVNYYKFTLFSQGSIYLNFKHENLFDSEEYWVATIYDSQTNEVAKYSFSGTDSNANTYKIGLDKGTYYIEITGGSWYAGLGYSGCFSTVTYTFSAKYSASSYWEKENSNNDMKTATSMYLNNEYNGSVCDKEDIDYYKFTLTSPGSIQLNFKHENLFDSEEYWVATIYDSQTNDIVTYSLMGSDVNVNTHKIGLDKGTYYIEITGGRWYAGLGYSGCFSTVTYTFSAKYSASSYWEKENSNNDMKTAPNITLSDTYTGSICDESDIDYYKFTLSKKMKIRLNFNLTLQDSDKEYYVVTIFDSKTNKLFTQGVCGNKKTTEMDVELPSGSYFIEVTGGRWYAGLGYSGCFITEDYSFAIKCGHTYSNVNNYKCDICGYTVTTPTLRRTNGVWYYYNNGVIDRSNTLVKYGSKWYHVNNGKWVKDTTLVKYGNAWYYVKNGVKNTANTLVKYGSKWYHVNRGVWVKDTTLVKYGNAWYYVKNGVKNTANTLVKYGSKWYHVKGGKWIKDTVFVKYNGKYYYVKNGIVSYVTGRVKVSGKWYKVVRGIRK